MNAIMQGYRPSHVPQELIEQIAAVVEAKAFLHVVSVSIKEHIGAWLAKTAMSSSTTHPKLHSSHSVYDLRATEPVTCVPGKAPAVLHMLAGACSRAGYEQPADGAHLC
jgi:hypothetical protein